MNRPTTPKNAYDNLQSNITKYVKEFLGLTKLFANGLISREVASVK